MRTSEHVNLLRQEAINLKKSKEHRVEASTLLNAALRMEQMCSLIETFEKLIFVPVVCVSSVPELPDLIVGREYKVNRLSLHYDRDGDPCVTVCRVIGKDICVAKLSYFSPDIGSTIFMKSGYIIPEYFSAITL